MKKESEELLAKEYIDKVECCDECFCEMFCIKNGLRKGREPYSECYKNVLIYCANDFLNVIDAQSTVDAVPVVHGHWIGEDYDGYSDGNPVYYTYRCSECGALFETDDEPLDFDFCPRCGAIMDEMEESTDE